MNNISDHAVDQLRPNGYGRQVRIRVRVAEEAAFKRAAELSGVTISAWVRQALREAAERRLANVGEYVPWVVPRGTESADG